MNELSETEKAYIAGIIDGEGSILVTRVSRPENRSGYRFYPIVSVTSTSKDLLDWLCKTTGVDKVYTKKESSIKAKRKCWRWALKQSHVQRLLDQVLPYLVIKKDSAENCLEFCKESINRGNYGKYDLDKMERFWKKSSELNMRGELLDPAQPVKSTQSRSKASMRAVEKPWHTYTVEEGLKEIAKSQGSLQPG